MSPLKAHAYDFERWGVTKQPISQNYDKMSPLSYAPSWNPSSNNRVRLLTRYMQSCSNFITIRDAYKGNLSIDL